MCGRGPGQLLIVWRVEVIKKNAPDFVATFVLPGTGLLESIKQPGIVAEQVGEQCLKLGLMAGGDGASPATATKDQTEAGVVCVRRFARLGANAIKALDEEQHQLSADQGVLLGVSQEGEGGVGAMLQQLWSESARFAKGVQQFPQQSCLKGPLAAAEPAIFVGRFVWLAAISQEPAGLVRLRQGWDVLALGQQLSEAAAAGTGQVVRCIRFMA
jgi:hypothetical protein